MCSACCQMDAITDNGAPPVIIEERCVGCALCVTTCPSEAMTLRRNDRRPPPPKDTSSLYSTMFQERYGPLGAAAAVAGHLLGRKF